MKKAVLILGATSSIARATADSLAAKGYPLYLAGRELSELERLASDLQIRYKTEVHCGHFDADQTEKHEQFIEDVLATTNGFEGVLVAFSDMGKHNKAIHDYEEAHKILQRNLLGAISILTYSSIYLEKQKRGFIIGISSPSGDRGRQSNYIYGAGKAGLSVYLEGLRNRLYPLGIHVMTVKPGFVDTAMTFGLPGLFLVASPKYVGEKIVKGLEKSKDIIYVPWFWRYIMWIICSIPEKLFKRLKL